MYSENALTSFKNLLQHHFFDLVSFYPTCFYNQACLLLGTVSQVSYVGNGHLVLIRFYIAYSNRILLQKKSTFMNLWNLISLQADQDKPLGFSHVFQLRPEAGGTFFIMHEIFRLAVFNFAA